MQSWNGVSEHKSHTAGFLCLKSRNSPAWNIRRLVAAVFNGVRSLCIQLSSRGAALQRWPLRVKGMKSIVLPSCTRRHRYRHRCGWLSILIVHETNGCNYPLDSSEISNDEHPDDEAYNWIQKCGCCVENFNHFVPGERGKSRLCDFQIAKTKKKKGVGGENRGSSSALYYEQFIRIHLFTEQHLISHCLPLVVSLSPSPPSIQLHLLGWHEEYAFMSSRHPPR